LVITITVTLFYSSHIFSWAAVTLSSSPTVGSYNSTQCKGRVDLLMSHSPPPSHPSSFQESVSSWGSDVGRCCSTHLDSWTISFTCSWNPSWLAYLFDRYQSGQSSTALPSDVFFMPLLPLQTTIEFYINYENRNDARAHGFLYRNPFDQGYRKNIRRFLGQGSWPSLLYPTPYLPYEPLYPLQLSPGVLKCEEFIV
jgi:hypothetical protein